MTPLYATQHDRMWAVHGIGWGTASSIRMLFPSWVLKQVPIEQVTCHHCALHAIKAYNYDAT